MWLVRPEHAGEAWAETCGRECGTTLYHLRGGQHPTPTSDATFTD